MKNPETPAHPSLLELDRFVLGAARADVAAHVAACEVCRGSLASLDPKAEVPAWARGLGPRRPRRSLSALLRSAVAGPRALGLGAAAVACGVLLWIAVARSTFAPTPAGSYVGTKGSPELRLYIKRGERVEVWNGAEPVVAGDLLRLKVQPDRFEHIDVFAKTKTKPSGGYERLYEGPLSPGQPTALPFSWRVDAGPGDETLVVVLGAASVAPADVEGLLSGGDGGRHWCRRLVLVKVAGRDGSQP